MAINLEKINGFVPKSVYDELPRVIEKYEFNTIYRLSHFLAQCEHESERFKFVRENLNYSAKALLAIFPSHFNEELANEYARNPEKIANRIYANRMGNGDEASGDGYKFRGRGYIQITGKENYEDYEKYINDDLINNPDLVATTYPLNSAGWFFTINDLNAISDEGVNTDVIKQITKKINGGYDGLAERIHFTEKFYNLLTR